MPTVGQLPFQKRGKEFLASSHFTVGMDKAFLEDTKGNSQKRDYQPIDVWTCKRGPAISLGDSHIMHTAAGEKLPVSQTKDSFQVSGVATREWNDYTGRLNTNFQNHSDKQCLSFRTTNSEHFTQENATKFDQQGQKSLMVSSVPQGDVNFIPFPESEVRGNFKGQNVDHIIPSRYPSYRDYGAIDTLKTDRRAPPAYPTTYKDLHTGKFDPAIKQGYGEAAVKRGTHAVGLGTEGPKATGTTNVREEYQPQEYTTTRYSKAKAVGTMLGTTFLFGGEKPFAGTGLETETTAKHYHTGASYGLTQSMKPENVFHSDLPKGDEDPARRRALQNDTSYAEHFPVRAPGQIINPKVKGEEIITRSRVVMGTHNDPLSASTASCYVSQAEHVKPRDRVDQLVKFRNGFSLGSTTEYRDAPLSVIQRDFQSNAGRQKFQHNPTVLSRLKDSHISLSHEHSNGYQTSYASLFYSKKPDPQSLAPKLQTSSVPLGTFSRYASHDGR